ncbi:MAG TPA: enoyl-CoA hydratase/isomerase family protein [Nocardioidaceae bacterium]|nr:enoyl-CoA hydratase/isomerase family protein [Nocardioidaceae bacterium]
MSFPSEDQLDEAGLRVDVDGPVLTVTLNRPDVRNAQTPSMWRALAAIGDGLDAEIRVAVVRGAGPTFSAGLDRQMMTPDGAAGEPTFPEIAAMADADADAVVERFQAGFGWWRRPEIVSIAAVQGAAVGAGFQLALACDLRIIADDARFCMREPALGLVPDLGGTKPLVEAVGYARAMELCATARWMDADEAVATGLATACVAGDQLNATVADLVAAVTAAPAAAVRATKALLVDAADRTYDEQCRAERVAQLARLRELATLLS